MVIRNFEYHRPLHKELHFTGIVACSVSQPILSAGIKPLEEVTNLLIVKQPIEIVSVSRYSLGDVL